MSTRRADPNAPLSQERYMSSPEFAGLRAISGTAVTKRCALLTSPAKRELIWWIQGLSILQGGCSALGDELLKMFPDRVGTPTMHKLGIGKGRRCSGTQVAKIKQELVESSNRYEVLARMLDGSNEVALELGECEPPRSWQNLCAECLDAAKANLPDLLIELCINPALEFQAPGEPDTTGELQGRIVRANYFQDIIGALYEYKRRFEERVKAEFCHTAFSRKLWTMLDYALKTKTMIVLDGLEGRGKTEAVRAWCKCHLGVARFVSLVGTNTKTSHFTEFAKAFGVGHSNSHKVSQMQASVQDVLRGSQLMLVVDEAHFFFNQALRMKTRPEMLDWIDTALCNPPLPVALITTPQFLICMERATGQVGWNYRQFRRRCKRYVRLAEKNAPEDIEAVARKLLPGADRATVKQIMAYEALSKRDLSAVGDVAREANLLAEGDGAPRVTFEHVKRAIHEVLLVSDVPWAEMEKRLQHQKLGRKAWRHPIAVAPETAPETAPEAAQEPAETRGRDILSRLTPSAPRGHRMRLQEPVSARWLASRMKRF